MLQILLGAISLGLLWAVMTIGVYITYRILDIADLSVEGSIAMGAAIAAQLIYNGNRLIMMHEGRIILDIRGEEKKQITVEDLLKRFGKVSGEVFANDRALLS